MMDQLVLRSWWAYAWRGAAALLFGILAFVWPGLTLLVFAALFAAFALMSGVATTIGAVRHRASEGHWSLMLLLGLVSIAAGVVALFYPGMTIFALVLLMAANAVATGVLDVVIAVRLRKQIEREWLLALVGAVSILFGVLVCLVPAAGAVAIVLLVSFYSVITGVLLLALAFRARKWTRRPDHAEPMRMPVANTSFPPSTT